MFFKTPDFNFVNKKAIAYMLAFALVVSSNPFGVFDSNEESRMKTILKNEKNISETIVKTASAAGDYDKQIAAFKKENEKLLAGITDLNSEICGLNAQIGLEDFDPTMKCKDENVVEVNKEKAQVKVSETNSNGKGYGYAENGNKMKWMLTRYYSPSYDQEYFKYSDKRKSNGKVAWAGQFFPTDATSRWNAYMADSLVQCGTSYVKQPEAKDLKVITDKLEHGCATPGITPFVDNNGKKHDYFHEDHAYNVVACDYKYIAKITDIGCSPTILSSTVQNSKEWNDALACRKKINSEITFKIEGVGEAKCADAGNAINGAHLDVWVGYGNTALTELKKGTLNNLQNTSYDIGLDGKKTTPRDGFWADVEIYKNGVKAY